MDISEVKPLTAIGLLLLIAILPSKTVANFLSIFWLLPTQNCPASVGNSFD
jgi:hypothetical protein